MKKGFVYVLLTSIILIPIVSIIVVEILNQNTSTYTSYNLSYDYNDLVTTVISIEDIEETIRCKGVFRGDRIENCACSISAYSSLTCNVEVGDYVEKNDCIFSVNGEDYCTKNSGVISKINISESEISVDIVKNQVTKIAVLLDVMLYPSVGKSSIYFTYGEKDYQYSYSGCKGIAADDAAMFEAYYNIMDGEDFIYGGEIDLYVKTGNIHRSVCVVPQNCVFKEGNTYYIEELGSNGITKIMVTLGLFSENNVEIFPEDGFDIGGGEVIVVNDTDVFTGNAESAQENEQKVDE